MDRLYLNFKMYCLKRKIKKGLGLYKTRDDFDWQSYTDHYQFELSQIYKEHSLILNKNDYLFAGGELKINKNIKPLHPNHRILYETILQLSPNSVFELGCGGGDHLHNISVLDPKIQLYGVDISPKQIKLLHQRHKDLKATVEPLDITLPHPDGSPVADIAYTQAVIMHIKTGNNHLRALENLFKYAKKQVILMENWTTHNFFDDIQQLFRTNCLPWDDMHFYYRISKEYNKPHLMVVSQIPLDYPELTDYNILIDEV
jgi:SAM-dependent methyltransferase